MGNPEHIRIVKQGAEAIQKWRREHPTEKLDLSGADLSEANLYLADLARANLNGTNLKKAKISFAYLVETEFIGADLTETDLVLSLLTMANLTKTKLLRAQLIGTNLTGAKLAEANLSGADIRGANFTEVNLSKANVALAVCRRTVIDGCDLHTVKGLETIQHDGPSTIGIDTIISSFRGAGNKLTPELKIFFLNTGVPKELLEELPKIISEVKYYNCFIAYGEPDKAFAETLRDDLRRRGVSCWAYSTDSTPGERTWMEIKQRRQEADKVIVVCSADALVRDGLLKEIEEQIDEGPDKMIPISLDNLWKEDGFRVERGKRDLKPFLKERNYADFSDPSKYEQSLDRLLKGLKREKAKKRRTQRT